MLAYIPDICPIITLIIINPLQLHPQGHHKPKPDWLEKGKGPPVVSGCFTPTQRGKGNILMFLMDNLDAFSLQQGERGETDVVHFQIDTGNATSRSSAHTTCHFLPDRKSLVSCREWRGQELSSHRTVSGQVLLYLSIKKTFPQVLCTLPGAERGDEVWHNSSSSHWQSAGPAGWSQILFYTWFSLRILADPCTYKLPTENCFVTQSGLYKFRVMPFGFRMPRQHSSTWYSKLWLTWTQLKGLICVGLYKWCVGILPNPTGVSKPCGDGDSLSSEVPSEAEAHQMLINSTRNLLFGTCHHPFLFEDQRGIHSRSKGVWNYLRCTGSGTISWLGLLLPVVCTIFCEAGQSFSSADPKRCHIDWNHRCQEVLHGLKQRLTELGTSVSLPTFRSEFYTWDWCQWNRSGGCPVSSSRLWEATSSSLRKPGSIPLWEKLWNHWAGDPGCGMVHSSF